VASATQTLYLTELRRAWSSNTDSAHDLAHIMRVWKTCQTIALVEKADSEILLPSAIFHDIINLPKDDPNRANASLRSADYTVQFLKTSRFAHSKLGSVHHAIQAHSFSANVPCETLEAKILQDADRLDALGAIGIARCFAISGKLDRALFDPNDPLAENRALNEEVYALDHFQTKLFKIAETLHTDTAKTIASDRIAFMRTFCDTLKDEIV
jgi:uncharacterized protein